MYTIRGSSLTVPLHKASINSQTQAIKPLKKTKSELGGIFSRDPKARRYKNHEGRTIKQRAAIMYAAKDIKYANDRKLKSCFWFRHGMFTDPEQIFQLTKRRVSL